MVRHQLGGQRIIGTHSLIDDVIAIDILQLRQFNGLFAGGRLARDADIHRIAGEIALLSANRDAAKAEAYFERALAVARKQQAKSWELRAAMSMARLWRDQGNPQQARELLAPVYGWFTEGFDTLDLKEAKSLLDELHA